MGGASSRTIKRIFAAQALKAIGWTAIGTLPEHKKFVLVGAPHTSNWDMLFLLLSAWKFNFDPMWIGKKSLFEPPLGWMMHALGGIPVDRSGPHNTVDQIAAVFAQHDFMGLTITPEGTRSRATFWKTGFYHIARAANVPLVLGIMDYEKRECGFGPSFYPSDDPKADMERIRAFYDGVTALYPEKFGPILLRSELTTLHQD